MDGASDAEEQFGPRSLEDEWLDLLAQLIADAPINLVSRADRAHVRSRHVDECVAVANALRLRDGARWMDLGTGGGLPGLVLAGAFPWVTWTLLDAREKKLVQVERFAMALALTNVQVVHGRAEELGGDNGFRATFDGVVSRAVASLADTAEMARGFLAPGGQVITIRGSGATAEAASASPVVHRLGLSIEDVEEIGGTIRPTWLVRLRDGARRAESTSGA